MANVGDWIEILHMDGEYGYAGRTGKITRVDSMGQLHGTWGGLAVQPERDRFRIIRKEGEEREDV